MSPALTDRIAILDTMSLLSGSHKSLNEGACIMEAVAYVAGESWSDRPACACPVISAFLRSWNDSLPTDADRDRLLKPLVLQLIDTKAITDVEERRAYLALDWMIRVFTPKWLDLVPSLAPHANRLRNLEKIADLAGARAAGAVGGRVAGDGAGAAHEADGERPAVDPAHQDGRPVPGAGGLEAAPYLLMVMSEFLSTVKYFRYFVGSLAPTP